MGLCCTRNNAGIAVKDGALDGGCNYLIEMSISFLPSGLSLCFCCQGFNGRFTFHYSSTGLVEQLIFLGIVKVFFRL